MENHIENLSKLKSDEMYSYIKNTINDMVFKLHNSTNDEDTEVCYIYSDGSIKSFENSVLKYECIKPDTFFTFPLKINGLTYGILQKEKCIEVRNLMDELLLLC